MSRNFGAAAGDYASYRVGFPNSLFQRLRAFGVGRPDQWIVDLGTGTGTLARGFAVNGSRVIGVDPDERLMAEARRLDQAAGVDVEYRTGTAETIPVDNDTADVVAAGQCWHWFNGKEAAREISRVVKAGGYVVVANFDWLPLPGSVVEATERLIESHNPDWHMGGGNGFHPESIADLWSHGFSEFESFSYDLDVHYTPDAWRGRIRASAGVGASLKPDAVEAFDNDLAQLLKSGFDAEYLQVPHRVFAIVGLKKVGG